MHNHQSIQFTEKSLQIQSHVIITPILSAAVHDQLRSLLSTSFISSEALFFGIVPVYSGPGLYGPFYIPVLYFPILYFQEFLTVKTLRSGEMHSNVSVNVFGCRINIRTWKHEGKTYHCISSRSNVELYPSAVKDDCAASSHQVPVGCAAIHRVYSWPFG
ncbi:MAG: hypothetical protein GY865_11120, partial [candidate division Zixibacteria bacterium]|nr:hypothetical protein [candidate division Zixibacteria bacterium]